MVCTTQPNAAQLSPGSTERPEVWGGGDGGAHGPPPTACGFLASKKIRSWLFGLIGFIGWASTVRKSLLMNRLAYARTKTSRKSNGEGNCKFESEICPNTTWEVGEQGSYLDFNTKVYIY